MRLTLADAEALVLAALMRNRVAGGAARSVTRALVQAEAAGQANHGLRRVPAYAAQARAGKADGHATPAMTRPRPGVLAIDARLGFAYPALDMAVDALPGVAREQGIALALIGRSHHAGVAGLTVEALAEAGLAAIMVANAPASMAPWGGRKPLFGTNPIAFAAPLPDADPIVVDMALSKVARGRVMAAQQKGIAIPEGWALDAEGRPTTDPDAAMAGTMVPAGDAKGAGLALMVELLSAGLTGSNYAFEASSLFDDRGPSPALGHVIIAIDPGAMAGNAVARFADMAREFAAQDGVRLPGRRGQTARAEALRNGLEIEEAVIEAVRRS